ncbi:hypothetical protein [Nitrosomonas sp.]|uniref:hypothetical protein n=1 Tax=Nitrosomonas sp. TaxID=42353 RepID=UPI0028400B22|nr:hypothetical protein [Nitrosomonas sp.]MDR4514404.1 hypothetical protein [Nitrosomonas sp.]
MYEEIATELVELGPQKRFLGNRICCRFCGTKDQSAFGGRTNAHTFPEALGNKFLFSLDECRSCNERFAVYEDALCKATGPFLTLGGVRGKRGVRQTGRSNSGSVIQHRDDDGHRHISVRSKGSLENVVGIDSRTGVVRLQIPIEGDKFVPLYAYKALTKIAIALLPEDELHRFRRTIESLQSRDMKPAIGPLQVGFSYGYVGNAPPTLAGSLIRRREEYASIPYVIAIFVAGSVCFQIWLRSDDKDNQVPESGKLGIRWTSQLPKPEGGYHPIKYSEPLQFNWSSVDHQFQPFEAFELRFNPITTEGVFTPIPREVKTSYG